MASHQVYLFKSHGVFQYAGNRGSHWCRSRQKELGEMWSLSNGYASQESEGPEDQLPLGLGVQDRLHVAHTQEGSETGGQG